MLSEQNLQARALIEPTSTQVRERQRAQESHLRMLNDELHREQVRSRFTVEVIEARHSTLNSRMGELVMQGQTTRDQEHQRA
eukprot:360504-Prorocentrum_lima.AAC.1